LNHIPTYRDLDLPGLKNPRAKVLALETRSSPSLMGLSADMVSEQEQNWNVNSRIKELSNILWLCVWLMAKTGSVSSLVHSVTHISFHTTSRII